MTMDTPSLPASFSNLPALSSYNRESSPAIPRSGRWNSETTGSPSGLLEVGPSRVRLESFASVPSSRVTGAIEVPHSGMNSSSPSHQRDLQFGYDCDIGTGGRTAMSSTSCGTDDRQGESIAEPCLAVADHGRKPDNSYPGKRSSSNYGPKVVRCNHCKGT
jgi:hypothetical protein